MRPSIRQGPAEVMPEVTGPSAFVAMTTDGARRRSTVRLDGATAGVAPRWRDRDEERARRHLPRAHRRGGIRAGPNLVTRWTGGALSVVSTREPDEARGPLVLIVDASSTEEQVRAPRRGGMIEA